ncbi:bZIP transcription factor 1 [Phytophthora citrophthora]|uniref:BZIP transcription factor 1 n=1 Tax=Phytophthora citrophthora TaxID=4793 RepID=A0AAD9G1F8_9STRA|nr:bZIP transcription factor 1 [Phytophthora citrophthora]
MASDSLEPPNSYCFSDEAISTVAQRFGPFEDQGSVHAGDVRDNEADTWLMASAGSSRQRNRLLHTRPSASARAAMANNLQKYGKLIKEIVLKRGIHRERCRKNQARYRKKQQKYLTDLETEVEQLREEIHQLEKQRRVISFGVPTKETVWSIAAEYFHLFRHGYIAPVAFSDSEITRQSHVQLEFLQATMSIDVMDGGVSGVDAHLENWRLFSLYHGDVQLQLERLEKGPGNSIVASMKTGITVTENTLRTLYLHLLVSESDDDKWSPLAYRLLDQRIEMDGSIRFVWDASSGRVTSLQITMNLLTPILRLVGSIANAARVFDEALITPEGKLL